MILGFRRQFVGLCLCAFSSVNMWAAAQPEVKVHNGKLEGVSSAGVDSFKGIPFAAPPVGALRWKAPQPAANWKGVRSAAQFGHDCMQLPFPSDAAPLGTEPAEDCLDLNVWRPTEHGSQPLPVMVWIYGGGFVNGGSSPAVYDGSQFARGGVVFVSFNYRLGRFGSFAHPALTEEAHGAPLGNYGYLDQIAALRWVHDNIAAFGGDPNNVTLFGESAGGGSVHAMVTSPLARNLLQKAIVESGGGRRGLVGSIKVHESDPAKHSGETAGVAFAKSKGIEGDGAAALAKLRELPAKEVVDGLNMASMFAAAKTYVGPMIDGQIVVEEPEDVYKAGTQPHIPFILGANSADIGFSFAKTMDELFAPFKDNAAAARAAYDPKQTGDVRATGMAVAADNMMIEPARFVAQELSRAGQPVWEFRFSYVAESMRKEWPGAPHATEIPFVFDTVRARYNDALTPADEKTAQLANAYWIQFAKTGNPNRQGLPEWPAYNANSDMLMNFTNDGPVAQADPWKQRLDFTAANHSK